MERRRILDYIMEAGQHGGWILALAMVCLASLAYFGGPPAVDVLNVPVLNSDAPPIPPELADHETRGENLERGSSVGATPNQSLPRPDAFLAGQGVSYAFKGSPNWSGRGTCPPSAIVLHVTGPGTMAGMASWFANPASQVSAHFGIGKKGEVQQYVEIGDAAWHAGIVNRPSLGNPLIAQWVREAANPNRCTIGIEMLLAGPAEPLADFPEMQRSLDLLLPWLLATTGIPADRTHIIGHYEIDSINRSTDPRCCASIESIVAKLGGAAPKSTEWADCDPAWSGWWNTAIRRWVGQGASLYDPIAKVWSSPPPCGV